MTCREVAHIVLREPELAATPVERVVLRLHWLACHNCRSFRDQARVVQRAMRRWKTYREGDDGPAGP
jgi:hypothetical protein